MTDAREVTVVDLSGAFLVETVCHCMSQTMVMQHVLEDSEESQWC